ncbi:MAG TPA: NEW3 domain-containing protein, partial [bacterium]
LGKTAAADFGLLRDVESLQISLNYGGRKDQKNIYLEKDASANIVDITSSQFSQEADLGSQANYDLTLERFSTSDDVYRLLVFNLPRQISYDFMDSQTNARLSQVKFTQGVNIKKLTLRTYLPERDDEQVVIDKPLVFYAMVLSRVQSEEMGELDPYNTTVKELDKLQGGRVRLELIPRGVGKIEVRAPSLYHEITVGDSVMMNITVKNNGSRRLDNIKVSTDNPLHWRSVIQPDLIKTIDPEKEQIVHLTFIPPSDVGVGAQEVRIKTEALADNRRVETEDKTVRIQVEAKTPILWTAVLILLLIGLVVGIVVFGIKISRR